MEIVGLGMMILAGHSGSTFLLFAALTIIVAGFALITPSVNSLISRRSDPAKQGGILGVTQSISALARIAGPLAGLTLFHLREPESTSWPLWLAIALLGFGLFLIVLAGRSGRDFPAESSGSSPG